MWTRSSRSMAAELLDCHLLVANLRTLPRLQRLELDLAHIPLGNGVLFGSLCLCTTLEVLLLNLSGCGLRNLDMVTLACLCQAPVRTGPRVPCADRLRELRLWLAHNELTDTGVITLLHRLDGAACLTHVHIDLTWNHVGLYGLLVAHEYRVRHPSATVAYVPQCMPVLLPHTTISSQQQLFLEHSLATRCEFDARWQHLTPKDGDAWRRLRMRQFLEEQRTKLVENRNQWMRIYYCDIVVDCEAWDGARPEWCT